MSVQLSPSAMFQGIGPNGIVAFGTLSTFIAGTATPQATFVDSTQTTQNLNPTPLNAAGQASVWLATNQTYKLVLKDSSGNQVWSQDQVPGGFATVAQLNLGGLFSTNGWEKSPNGVIRQWGMSVVTTGTPLAIAFPTTFPTALWSLVFSLTQPAGGANTGYVTSPTTGSFTANVNGSAGTNSFNWQAVGN